MTTANGAGERVTENTLNRIQEDLNRAFHKLSVATGNDTRCQAAAIESAAAKRAAADEVGRLQSEQTRLTAIFHEQRAPEFGIKPSADLSASITQSHVPTASAEAIRRELTSQSEALPGAVAGKTAEQIPIEVGDSVRHIGGGPELIVEHVSADEVECSYKDDDGVASVWHKPNDLLLVSKKAARTRIDDTAASHM